MATNIVRVEQISNSFLPNLRIVIMKPSGVDPELEF
jgi:hypothetical protein